jgi:flagellar hook-basal body complex protein FliE
MVAAISSNIQGIEAYNKVLKASRGMKPQESMQAAEQSMNILRAGDNLEVVSIGKQAAMPKLFPEILSEVAKEQSKKIKIADRRIKNAISSDDEEGGSSSGGDLIEIMAAVNESEMALQVVVAARDRFINSYQEILKMPL